MLSVLHLFILFFFLLQFNSVTVSLKEIYKLNWYILTKTISVLFRQFNILPSVNKHLCPYIFMGLLLLVLNPYNNICNKYVTSTNLHT